MTPKWEIKVVENAGELQGNLNAEDVVVPTKPLITDIKSQLMFIPKQFSWTVGWRAYVWQKKEGGIFKDLNASEYLELTKRGTVSYTRETDGDSGSSTPVTSGEASTS